MREKRLNTKNIYLIIVSIFLVWFIIAFLVYPNLKILGNAFYQDGKFSLEAADKILNSSRAMRSLRNSFILGAVLMVTSNILGLFVLLVTEYFDIRGSKFLKFVYMIPMVFGGVVLANGYLFAYGSNGLLTRFLIHFFSGIPTDWFRGFLAVVLIMTFACTTNHLIFVKNALHNIDYQTVEAARNMGAGQFYILWRVVFPTLAPVLLTCTVLLFQTGLMAMSAPAMVGGDFQTIGPLLLSFSGKVNSRDLACILAIFLGTSEILLLSISMWIEKKGNYTSVSKVKIKLEKQKIENSVVNAIVHIVAYLLVIVYLVPLLLVILFSFTDTYSITTMKFSLDRLTFDNYLYVFGNLSSIKPFITSIAYAGFSSLLVIILVIMTVRIILKHPGKLTGLLEYVLHIPWFIPPVMVALGLIVAYNTPNILIGNKRLAGGVIVLLLCYIITLIPYTFRMIKAGFASFDTNLEDAAKNLGASSIRTFLKIVLPYIWPVILAVFVLNFNGKLSDYDMSAFLYHPLYPTLGVQIKANVSAYTNPNAIALNLVYSVILVGVGTLVMYLVYGKGTKNKDG